MPYLILDLEMTGGEVGYHDIIQIGAVLADDNWNPLSEFESLVFPENEEAISTYSEAVHGISLQDLDDAPMPHEMIENFEAWIRKTLKRNNASMPLTDIIVCGQSVINDINFLKFAYSDLNIAWPFSFKLIDLMSLSFVFYQIFDLNGVKRPKSYSLKAVAEHFKVYDSESAHNALSDAKMTHACFTKYFEVIKQLKYTP